MCAAFASLPSHGDGAAVTWKLQHRTGEFQQTFCGRLATIRQRVPIHLCSANHASINTARRPAVEARRRSTPTTENWQDPRAKQRSLISWTPTLAWPAQILRRNTHKSRKKTCRITKLHGCASTLPFHRTKLLGKSGAACSPLCSSSKNTKCERGKKKTRQFAGSLLPFLHISPVLGRWKTTRARRNNRNHHKIIGAKSIDETRCNRQEQDWENHPAYRNPATVRSTSNYVGHIYHAPMAECIAPFEPDSQPQANRFDLTAPRGKANRQNPPRDVDTTRRTTNHTLNHESHVESRITNHKWSSEMKRLPSE